MERNSISAAKTMKNILLADDDPFILDIYSIKFKKEGYKLDVAKNCQTALEKIRANPPDLVILDIDFGPGEMNGWELLKIIRGDAKIKDVKVIILSNHNEQNYPHDVLSLKATKFFLKVETNIEDIMTAVKEILK